MFARSVNALLIPGSSFSSHSMLLLWSICFFSSIIINPSTVTPAHNSTRLLQKCAQEYSRSKKEKSPNDVRRARPVSDFKPSFKEDWRPFALADLSWCRGSSALLGDLYTSCINKPIVEWSSAYYSFQSLVIFIPLEDLKVLPSPNHAMIPYG